MRPASSRACCAIKASVDLEPVADPADMQALQNLIAQHVRGYRQPARQMDSRKLG